MSFCAYESRVESLDISIFRRLGGSDRYFRVLQPCITVGICLSRWHEILRSAPVSSRGGKSTAWERIKPFWSLVADTSGSRARVMAEVCAGDDCGDPAKFAAYASTNTARGSDVFRMRPIGIHAALVHSSRYESNARRGYALISAELLTFLFTEAESNNATVTVARTSKGLQPLCAIYRRDFLPVAERRCGREVQDRRRVRGSSVRVIDAGELAARFSERVFQCDTPQDLKKALKE